MDLHRLAALAALLLVAGPTGLADPTPTHARERSCGNVELVAGTHVEVRVDGTTCNTGSRMLAWYLTTDAPCTGSGCFRKRRGWSCGSAAFGFRPRLFSCERSDGAVARAYEMRDRALLRHGGPPMLSCGRAQLRDGSHVEVMTYFAACSTARSVLSRASRHVARCRVRTCSWSTGRWSCSPASDHDAHRELFGCLGWDEYVAAYTMRGRVTL